MGKWGKWKASAGIRKFRYEEDCSLPWKPPAKRECALRILCKGVQCEVCNGIKGVHTDSQHNTPPHSPQNSTHAPEKACAIARVHKRRSAQRSGRKLARQWPKRPQNPSPRDLLERGGGGGRGSRGGGEGAQGRGGGIQGMGGRGTRGEGSPPLPE